MSPAGFPTYPEAYGIDAAGADTYTTLVTPTDDKEHLYLSLQGSYDAIVSIDGGVTDHFYIPAGTTVYLDALLIKAGVAIQGKNATAGSNYTKLAASIW